jgi:hypothetical protein
MKVFWIDRTARERVSLRRYKGTHEQIDNESVKVSECPLPWGYHDASVIIGEQPETGQPISDPDHLPELGYFTAPTKDDLRWPTHCSCGYAFQANDRWQVFTEPLYRATDGHWEGPLRDAPVGAMYNAEWMADLEMFRGPDGLSLHVVTPGGPWCVDQEASNCTRTQYEDAGEGSRRWTGRSHYCWVRHGDPRTGNIHVDKSGDTCAAGAGSIIIGGYHGFLHNGELTSC